MTDTDTDAWPSDDDLGRLGNAEEIEISTRREDGSLRAFVPIWVVAVDGALYVRSYRGATGAWYRHASRHSSGSVRRDGLRRDIAFVHPSDEVRDVIDDAYRDKYARYGESYLRTMLAEPAVVATLRLVPQP